MSRSNFPAAPQKQKTRWRRPFNGSTNRQQLSKTRRFRCTPRRATSGARPRTRFVIELWWWVRYFVVLTVEDGVEW